MGPYPKDDGPMKEAGDSLIDLCEISFDRFYRYEGGMNPTIQSFTRVECPEELTALTQMMDCRKPSGGWPDNVKDENMQPGMKLIQPCTADGYTRIDVQCGCYDCYC